MEPPGIDVDVDRMEWSGDPSSGMMDSESVLARMSAVDPSPPSPPPRLPAVVVVDAEAVDRDASGNGSGTSGCTTASAPDANRDHHESKGATSVISAGNVKPQCRYGRGCSHTSAFHRARFAHPSEVGGGTTIGVGSLQQQQPLPPASGPGGAGSGPGATAAAAVFSGKRSGSAMKGPRTGGFVCNECGLDFGSVRELQVHMVRKTAWSNQGLIGCRVSCLVDNREWHEGLVTQVGRRSEDYSSINRMIYLQL